MTLTVTTRYILRLALTDKYGTVSVTGSLPSAAFAMHLNAAGNSIAFGKACERSNAVEIAAGRTLYLGDSTPGGLHPGAGQNDHGAGLDTEHVFSGGGHLSILRGHVPGVAVGGTWTQIQNRFLVAWAAAMRLVQLVEKLLIN